MQTPQLTIEIPGNTGQRARKSPRRRSSKMTKSQRELLRRLDPVALNAEVRQRCALYIQTHMHQLERSLAKVFEERVRDEKEARLQRCGCLDAQSTFYKATHKSQERLARSCIQREQALERAWYRDQLYDDALLLELAQTEVIAQLLGETDIAQPDTKSASVEAAAVATGCAREVDARPGSLFQKLAQSQVAAEEASLAELESEGSNSSREASPVGRDGQVAVSSAQTIQGISMILARKRRAGAALHTPAKHLETLIDNAEAELSQTLHSAARRPHGRGRRGGKAGEPPGAAHATFKATAAGLFTMSALTEVTARSRRRDAASPAGISDLVTSVDAPALQGTPSFAERAAAKTPAELRSELMDRLRRPAPLQHLSRPSSAPPQQKKPPRSGTRGGLGGCVSYSKLPAAVAWGREHHLPPSNAGSPVAAASITDRPRPSLAQADPMALFSGPDRAQGRAAGKKGVVWAAAAAISALGEGVKRSGTRGVRGRGSGKDGLRSGAGPDRGRSAGMSHRPSASGRVSTWRRSAGGSVCKEPSNGAPPSLLLSLNETDLVDSSETVASLASDASSKGVMLARMKRVLPEKLPRMGTIGMELAKAGRALVESDAQLVAVDINKKASERAKRTAESATVGLRKWVGKAVAHGNVVWESEEQEAFGKHVQAIYELKAAEAGLEVCEVISKAWRKFASTRHLQVRDIDMDLPTATVLASVLAELCEESRLERTALRVQSLHLRRAGLDDDEMQALLTGCRGAWLEELNVGLNPLTADAVPLLLKEFLPPSKANLLPAPMLWKSLRKLDVTGWPLGDLGCSALGSSLEACESLTQLSIGHVNLTDLGAAFLKRLLLSLPQLDHLSLERNSLGRRSVEALADTIRHGIALRTLDLSWNSLIGDSAATVIWAMLENSAACRIESLRIQGVAMGDETGMAVSCLLASQSSAAQLQRLDISHNNVTGVGGQCMMREMAAAAGVKAIALHCVAISQPTKFRLDMTEKRDILRSEQVVRHLRHGHQHDVQLLTDASHNGQHLRKDGHQLVFGFEFGICLHRQDGIRLPRTGCLQLRLKCLEHHLCPWIQGDQVVLSNEAA